MSKKKMVATGLGLIAVTTMAASVEASEFVETVTPSSVYAEELTLINEVGQQNEETEATSSYPETMPRMGFHFDGHMARVEMIDELHPEGTIYYSLNSGEWKPYTGPFEVTTEYRLQFSVRYPDGSEVLGEIFGGVIKEEVEYPDIIEPTVTVNKNVVTIEVGQKLPEGSKIVYTLDENSVDGWTEYTGPFEVFESQAVLTVKALYPNGDSSMNTYHDLIIELPEIEEPEKPVYPSEINPGLYIEGNKVTIAVHNDLPLGTIVSYRFDGTGEWVKYSSPFEVDVENFTIEVKVTYPDGTESNSYLLDGTAELPSLPEIPDNGDGEEKPDPNPGEGDGENPDNGNGGEDGGENGGDGEQNPDETPEYPSVIYPTLVIDGTQFELVFEQPLPEGAVVMYALGSGTWEVYEGPIQMEPGMFYVLVKVVYPDGTESNIRQMGSVIEEPTEPELPENPDNGNGGEDVETPETPETPKDEEVAAPGQIQDVVIEAGGATLDFKPDQYDYKLDIPELTDEVVLNFDLPAGSNVQKITINGVEVAIGFPLTVMLGDGETVVKITVASSARSVNTYTFVLNKNKGNDDTTQQPDVDNPVETPDDTDKPSTDDKPEAENKPSTDNKPNVDNTTSPETKPEESKPTQDNSNNGSSNSDRPVTGMGGVLSVLSGLGLIGGSSVTLFRRKK